MGTREVINPPDLWNSSGRSYSHVVKVTNPSAMIFVAGLAGVGNDLAVVSDDIEEQTRATFELLAKELDAAGASLADVADMTVYLLDIENHAWPVRNVRSEFWSEGNLPVSTMIEVRNFAIEGMLIEVDAIAVT